MQITQTLRRSADLYPHRAGTIYRDRKRTWREIEGRVQRVAGALRSFGVGRNDYVPVLSFNNDRYVELFYAIPWAGAVIVPLNIRWAEAEIVAALAEVKPVVIFLDDAFLRMADNLRKKLPSLRHVVAMGEAPAAAHLAYEALVDDHAAIPDAGRSGNDPYTLFYTGGTTGLPRGVSISHQNVIFASLSYISELQLTCEMVHMHVGGMFHLSGAGHMWYTTMVGGCHVILPKFEVGPVLEAIEQHRVTNTVLLPTMVNMLLHHERAGEYDLTSMQSCIYGGSPMPEALIKAFMQRLPTWSFTQVYAMTESTGLATFLPWRRHFDKEGAPSKIKSVGQPALGVEIRIVDGVGAELPKEAVGEIAIRGFNVMLGYASSATGAITASSDGFLKTGDLGWIDEDNFLYVVDRAKDMIISGGENVYSAEVENALYKHPGVRECAVIGIPDATWGEAVLAIVVLNDGVDATEAEVIDHCRKLIAGFKCPKQIEFRSVALPVSPAGKIKKDALRAPYWIGASRAVN